jgi:DNA-binding response OmpR family regulator
MTFAKPADLVRFLLRQSDRHPVRAVSADDLRPFDQKFVRNLRNAGILQERADLTDDGDAVLDVVDGVLFEVDIVTGACVRIKDALDIQLFDINFEAVCAAIRDQSGLSGPPMTFLSDRAVHMGRAVRNGRSAEVCLVRRFRPERAIEVINLIRGAIDDEAHVAIISFSQCDLPTAVTRQLTGLRVGVSNFESHLGDDPTAPFAFDLSDIRFAPTETSSDARLQIDRFGHRAQMDGVELVLEPRDFGVFVLLAEEAAGSGGWVPRETISATVRAATNNDGNEEQADKSINRLRDVFRKNYQLNDVPSDGFIRTKRKTGFRFALPLSAIHFTG